MTFLAAPLIAALSQLGGLAGGILLIARRRLAHRLATFLLSFAAGTLLGVTFLDILPEAFEAAENPARVAGFMLLGIVLFFLIEKILLWHHHATSEDGRIATIAAGDTHVEAPLLRGTHVRPLVMAGDGLHNFLDGVTIAVTYAADPALGMTTAVAVLFHELPHNISDFAILLHTGMRRRAVLAWNVTLVFASPFGALLGAVAIHRVTALETPLLAVTAGNFLYIALANLLPEIHHEKRPWRIVMQMTLLLGGIAMLWAFGRFFPEGG